MRGILGLGCISLLMPACVSLNSYDGADLTGSVLWSDTLNPLLGQTVPVHLRVAQGNGHKLAQLQAHFSADAACTVAPVEATTDAQGRADTTLSCNGTGAHVVKVSVSQATFLQQLSNSLSFQALQNLDGAQGIGVGQPLNVGILVPDSAAEPTHAWRGSVHFSSSDTLAALPADLALTGAEQGFAELKDGMTFNTPGVQTWQITNASTGVLLSSGSYNITAETGVDLQLSGLPDQGQAGTPVQVTVSVLDSKGQRVPGYRRTVTLTSSDANALLPAPYVFTVADAGAHTFNLTLRSAGAQTVQASDSVTLNAGGLNHAQVAVTAAPAQRWRLDLPATARAGDALTAALWPLDAYGNAATANAIVHVTCTDSQAMTPQDQAFSPDAAGKFELDGLVLFTAGTVSITVTDTAGRLAAVTAVVNVSAINATSFTVQAPATATAGVALDLAVTARDRYGNVADGYTGSIGMDGSDAGALYPGIFKFSSPDAGLHNFLSGVVLATAGAQTIRVADVAQPALYGETTVTVAHTQPRALRVLALPASATAGDNIAFQIAAVDAYGNLSPEYTGTVHFTSSDGSATLPGNVAFVADSNGVMAVPSPAVLRTAGSQSLRAADTSTAALFVGTGTVQIAPGPAASIKLLNLASPINLSVAQTATVQAIDAYGNTATGYTGTVHLTSTDANALLPADYTFMSGQGTHAVSLTLQTVGVFSVTLTDGGGLSDVHNNLRVEHFPTYFINKSTNWQSASYTLEYQLTLDAQGAPHIIWEDVQSSASAQLYSSAFINNAWTPLFPNATSGGGLSGLVAPGCPNDDTQGLGLSVQGTKTRVVYAASCNNGNDHGLIVVDFDATGAHTGLAGSDTYPGIFPAADQNISHDNFGAQFRTDGTPVIFFTDTHGWHLRAYSNNAWGPYTPQEPQTSVANPEQMAFALDANDAPYVAFQSGTLGQYEIYVTAWNGTAWAGVGSASGRASTTSGNSKNPRLAVNTAQQPVVAWVDDSNAGLPNTYVAQYNGTAWVPLGSSTSGSGISNLPYVSATRVVFDSNGLPFVAWSGQSPEGFYNVYFKRWNGTAWVDTLGSSQGLGVTQQETTAFLPDFVVQLDASDIPTVLYSHWYGDIGEILKFY